MKVRLEYIYLDGYTAPIKSGGEEKSVNANVRSKTKIVNYSDLNYNGREIPNLESLPKWGSDGSSSKQAIGDSSDIVLKPVYICKDPTRESGSFLVLCETYDKDGKPLKSNTRAKFAEVYKRHENREIRFGYEQEYVVWDNKKQNLIGWPERGNPDPQGRYYCGVGSWNVAGRDLAERHMNLCIKAGLREKKRLWIMLLAKIEFLIEVEIEIRRKLILRVFTPLL